jgi:SAM-dependent methyltransferase
MSSSIMTAGTDASPREELYATWDPVYWGAHEIVLRAVRPAKRVLDVGCATGNLAVRLKNDGIDVVGVEPNPAAAAVAEGRGLEVIVAPFQESTVEMLSGQRFDVIVFADSLEHMADPLAALILARALLEKGGRVVISVPNVTVWHARARIAMGRFEYSDGGIFDRTHLRFFNLRSARRLVLAAGFRTEHIWTTRVALPFGPGWLRRIWDEAYGRVAPIMPRLLAEQFVMMLCPEAERPVAGSWP